MAANGDIVFGIKITASGKDAAAEVAAVRAETDSLGTSLKKVQAQNAAMATGHKQTATAAAAHAEELTALDDELARFLTVADPAYKAQRLLDTGNDLLTRSLKAGLLSQAQYDAALARLAAKYGPSATGAKALAGAHGTLGNNTAFATREVTALFDEISSGRDRRAIGTMTLLTTRMTGVGLAGIAAGGAVLGIVAAFGALTLVAERDQEALNKISAQLTATGRGSDLTRDQVSALVDELSLMPGVSHDAATKTVAAIAQIADIGGQMFEQIARLADDFATATGTKVPDAAAKLARAFADPARGAKQLDDQLNFLTADQLVAIERMAAQGRTLEAQQALYDALKNRIQGLTQQSLTPMQQKTDELGNAWDRFMASMRDSGAISAVEGGIAAIVSSAAWLIDHASALGSVLRTLGPLLGVTDVASQYAIPHSNVVSGKINRPAATSSPDQQNALQLQVKQALEAGDAYDTLGRKERGLQDTATRLRAAMQKLADAGKQNSDAYKQLGVDLKGVNDQLAKLGTRGQSAIDNAISSLGQSNAKLQFQLQYLQQHGSLPDTGTALVQAQFETQSPAGKFYAQPQAQKQALLAAAQQQDTLRQRMQAAQIAAQAEVDQAQDQVDLQNTLAQARDRQGKALEQQAIAGDQYVQQLEFQNSLLGLTSTQQQRLTALRQVDVNVQQASIGKSKEYQEELEGVAYTIKQGISKAFDDAEAAQQDWHTGLLEGIADVNDQVGSTAQNIRDAFVGGFSDAEQAGIEFFTGSKDAASDFFTALAQDIARLYVRQEIEKPIIDALFGAGSSAGTGLIASIGGRISAGLQYSINPFGEQAGMIATQNAGLFHSGGIIGEATTTRRVPAALFANAPRFHGGGLIGADEVPIIGRKGERVLTAEQQKNMGSTLVFSPTTTISAPGADPSVLPQIGAMLRESEKRTLATLQTKINQGGAWARTVGRRR
jgi:lambda family phage tail tape measure protein